MDDKKVLDLSDKTATSIKSIGDYRDILTHGTQSEKEQARMDIADLYNSISESLKEFSMTVGKQQDILIEQALQLDKKAYEYPYSSDNHIALFDDYIFYQLCDSENGFVYSSVIKRALGDKSKYLMTAKRNISKHYDSVIAAIKQGKIAHKTMRVELHSTLANGKDFSVYYDMEPLIDEHGTINLNPIYNAYVELYNKAYELSGDYTDIPIRERLQATHDQAVSYVTNNLGIVLNEQGNFSPTDDLDRYKVLCMLDMLGYREQLIEIVEQEEQQEEIREIVFSPKPITSSLMVFQKANNAGLRDLLTSDDYEFSWSNKNGVIEKLQGSPAQCERFKKLKGGNGYMLDRVILTLAQILRDDDVEKLLVNHRVFISLKDITAEVFRSSDSNNKRVDRQTQKLRIVDYALSTATTIKYESTLNDDLINAATFLGGAVRVGKLTYNNTTYKDMWGFTSSDIGFIKIAEEQGLIGTTSLVSSGDDLSITSSWIEMELSQIIHQARHKLYDRHLPYAEIPRSWDREYEYEGCSKTNNRAKERVREEFNNMIIDTAAKSYNSKGGEIALKQPVYIVAAWSSFDNTTGGKGKYKNLHVFAVSQNPCEHGEQFKPYINLFDNHIGNNANNEPKIVSDIKQSISAK